MRRNKIFIYLGLLLVVLGIGAIIAGQLTCTKEEKLIEVGSVEASVTRETRCFDLPEGIGIAVTAAGVALLLIGSIRKKTK